MPTIINDTTTYPNDKRVMEYTTVTFSAGGSISSSFQMAGYAGGAILCNSGFEGVVHYQVSVDGSTWYPLQGTDGSALYTTMSSSGTVASTGAAGLMPDGVYAAYQVRLATKTDSAGTAFKNQTSAGTVTVILKS